MHSERRNAVLEDFSMEVVSNAIPDISHEEAKDRVGRVMLMMRARNGESFRSFEVGDGIDRNLVEMATTKMGLSVVGAKLDDLKVYTLRTAGGQFCPSAREVVAQIPEEILETVRFIELLPEFEQAPGADYFVLNAVLYAAA